MINVELDLKQIINLNQHPIDNEIFIRSCENELDQKGVLTCLLYTSPSPRD